MTQFNDLGIPDSVAADHCRMLRCHRRIEGVGQLRVAFHVREQYPKPAAVRAVM